MRYSDCTFYFWRHALSGGTGDLLSIDSSSFLIFLIMNVLCLEFGIKKRLLIGCLNEIIDN